METNIDTSTGEGLFHQLYAELQEEGGITQDDIKDCQLKGVYMAASAYVGFYFHVNLVLTAEEVRKKFIAIVDDVDIKGILFLTESEYKETLANHSSTKRVILEMFSKK